MLLKGNAKIAHNKITLKKRRQKNLALLKQLKESAEGIHCPFSEMKFH
jgi:hypothetical protein